MVGSPGRAGVSCVLALAAAGCSASGLTEREMADYVEAVAEAVPTEAVDGWLVSVPGHTHVLRVTRADGLDRLGSTLDATLFAGVTPTDTTAEIEAAAAAGGAVPLACGTLVDAFVASRGVVGITEDDASLLGWLGCYAMLTRVDGLLVEDGDLDAAIERDLVPWLATSDYTIDSAHVEVGIGGVTFAPRIDGFDVEVSFDGLAVVFEEADFGPIEDDIRGDATFSRATATWSATLVPETDPFPWNEECGEIVVPNHPPEADGIPRGLSFLALESTVTGDFAVDHVEFTRVGVAEPYVEWRATRAARDLADTMSQTAPLPEIDLVFPARGAVVTTFGFVTDASGTHPELVVEVGFDPDGDLHLTGVDNCPWVANEDQQDLDLDGVGDVCDPVMQPYEDWMWTYWLKKMVACDFLELTPAIPPRVELELDPTRHRLVDELVRWTDLHGFDWRWLVIDEDPGYPHGSPWVFADEAALRHTALENLERLGAIVQRPELAREVVLFTVPTVPGFVGLRVDRASTVDRFGPEIAAMVELVVPDRFAPVPQQQP